ncbi:MAG: hypothetical protein U0519_04950 [Candidatus Gracilibacteria bacterium]
MSEIRSAQQAADTLPQGQEAIVTPSASEKSAGVSSAARVGTIRGSMRRTLILAGLAAPLTVGSAAMAQGCGLEIGGTGILIPDASEDAPETSIALDSAADSWEVFDGAADSEAEVPVDAAADSLADAAPDASDTGVDAGPQVTLSNAPGKNECVHWLTAQLGTTKGLASNNHICEPKPLGAMSIAAGYDIYFWSKDVPSNNTISFALPMGLTPDSYKTKCSSYSNPPDKTEMETELFTGGYTSIANGASLPTVELNNAVCTNGTAFVIHIAP